MLTHHVWHAHAKAWHSHAILHGHHRVEAIHGAKVHVAETLLVLVEAESLLLGIHLCSVLILLLLLLSIVSCAVLLVLRLCHLGFWSFGDNLHVALIGRVFIIDAFLGLVVLDLFRVALFCKSASAREVA